jgi:hypothetical protein
MILNNSDPVILTVHIQALVCCAGTAFGLKLPEDSVNKQ